MYQFAWLDYYAGQWHLVTGNSRDPERTWTDKYAALQELVNEGWTIARSRAKLLRENQVVSMQFHGYGLARVIQ